MSVYAGPADWWTDRTNIGRTHIATKGVVQTGLVLNLDSGVSSSYAGSGSTWTDLSGNGNHGTLTFGPTYSSSNGGEIVFDGVNDYVSFNNLTTSSLGLTSSNGATLSCWLKITLLSRWTGVLVFSNLNTVDIGWDITPSNVLRIWKNSAQFETSSLSSYSNIWCQYTLISNSSGTIFYINGNQFATTSTTGDVTKL